MTTEELFDAIQNLLDCARRCDHLPEARQEILDELDWAFDSLKQAVLIPMMLADEPGERRAPL